MPPPDRGRPRSHRRQYNAVRVGSCRGRSSLTGDRTPSPCHPRRRHHHYQQGRASGDALADVAAQGHAQRKHSLGAARPHPEHRLVSVLPVSDVLLLPVKAVHATRGRRVGRTPASLLVYGGSSERIAGEMGRWEDGNYACFQLFLWPQMAVD